MQHHVELACQRSAVLDSVLGVLVLLGVVSGAVRHGVLYDFWGSFVLLVLLFLLSMLYVDM